MANMFAVKNLPFQLGVLFVAKLIIELITGYAVRVSGFFHVSLESVASSPETYWLAIRNDGIAIVVCLVALAIRRLILKEEP